MSYIQDAQIVQVPSLFTLPPINATHPNFPWPDKSSNYDRDRTFPSNENTSPRSTFSTMMDSTTMGHHQRASLPLPQLHAYNNFPTTFTQSTTPAVRLPPPDQLQVPSTENQSSIPQSIVQPSKTLDLSPIINAHSADKRKRQMLKNHPLMPRLRIFVESVRKDCFKMPDLNVEQPSYQDDDFSLDSFLIAQGFDEYSLSEVDLQLTEEQEEDRKLFLEQVQQVRSKYQKEIQFLETIASKAIQDMECILNAQYALRPPFVIEEEKACRSKSTLQKFEGLKTALRQQACSSILVLQKRFHIQNISKKRKNLPKKATQVLSDWFFDHIQDPYPSEAEKIVLAAKGGLTLVQINYWFANKRIRYKKKCQEEEQKRKDKAKRLKLVQEEAEVLNKPPSKSPIPKSPSKSPSSQAPAAVASTPTTHQLPQYDNIKLALSPPRTTFSHPSSPSKSVMHANSPFLFQEPCNNNPGNNFAPLQVNRSQPVPFLPGISNLDPFFDVPVAVAVPVPAFSDQRFPSFPSPHSLERT